ncbi:TPA: hypothetical protein N3C02_004217 [Vibrio parahaemolyticus]|uniref:hypothetical protein n=1 Tax=Vibrio parahaemolyticus TaxID=670 RepID=UPI00046E6193|nr:hypothetical protein [Vibrio parahaemolyticus]EGQ7945939.1 hypothetical protein [Vibrio parahaemolyticus]EHH2464392.1 hypothetical protein [Vibrio parahaemolyticus]EHR6442182.1 hypothetical protein [Vibrio parahaemolyticus]MBM4941493.1 hypothetical protein [Vibrio parahaemolyticus]MCC3820276.1 hypothetical protein [Vibrio parahaemolyticus]
MTIEHQFKKLRNPAFAHSFADLMMGAMGIIIVLLIFLKIVEFKGQGSAMASSDLTLPPGLRDLNAHPLVRLRLSSCGTELETMPINVATTSLQKPFMSKGQIGDCIVQSMIFPQGLQGTSLQLIAVGRSDNPISFTFNIGGFSFQERLRPFQSDAGVVAIINPESRKIIEIR